MSTLLVDHPALIPPCVNSETTKCELDLLPIPCMCAMYVYIPNFHEYNCRKCSHQPQTDTLAALSAAILISFPQLFLEWFIILWLDPCLGLVIQFVEVVPMLKVLHIYYLEQVCALSV